MFEEYVTPEEGRKLFPDDVAVILYCEVCKAAILAKPGDEPDCGRHQRSREQRLSTSDDA